MKPVNGVTGGYLRRSDVPDAGEASLRGHGSYIQPFMTKPFPLRGATARLPAWEEEILLEENGQVI